MTETREVQWDRLNDVIVKQNEELLGVMRLPEEEKVAAVRKIIGAADELRHNMAKLQAELAEEIKGYATSEVPQELTEEHTSLSNALDYMEKSLKVLQEMDLAEEEPKDLAKMLAEMKLKTSEEGNPPSESS